MPSLSDVFASNDSSPDPAGTSPVVDTSVDPYGDPATSTALGSEDGGQQDGSGTLIGVMPQSDDDAYDG